jgi:hypothetical protein
MVNPLPLHGRLVPCIRAAGDDVRVEALTVKSDKPLGFGGPAHDPRV